LAGTTTLGNRLDRCRAIPLYGVTFPEVGCGVPCPRLGHGLHAIGVDELIAAGRRGIKRRLNGDTTIHVAHVDGVQR